MLQIPAILLPHFRTNHAGEMGAVFIYKGILFWSKHHDIVKFSREHLSTELNHLKKIEQIIPNKEKSKLSIAELYEQDFKTSLNLPTTN